jgi:Rrf2 family protein
LRFLKEKNVEITTKGRYAVRIMTDLARNGENFVPLTTISQSEQISVKYLEKITAMLSKAGLVESQRGASGGYRLAKKIGEISVKQILDATGDNVKVSTCDAGQSCPKASSCDTIGVWNTLNEIITSYLQSVTLKDLIDQTCERKLLK